MKRTRIDEKSEMSFFSFSCGPNFGAPSRNNKFHPNSMPQLYINMRVNAEKARASQSLPNILIFILSN